MKYTKYNNLNVPDLTDQYNLKHWNENTEKIDDKLNEHQMKLDTSTPETTPSSLMMRNEQGKVKVTTPLEQDDTNMAVNIDYLMNAFRTKMLDEAHPKGEIYYTEDSTFDPNTAWVGTWVRVKERFIWAIGDNDGSAGDTGGSKKIKPSNLPKHTHLLNGKDAGTTYGGSHSHTLNYDSINLGSTSYAWTRSKSSGGSTVTDTIGGGAHSHSLKGSTADGGFANTDYMPPYEKAFCWKRTE